LLDHPGLPPELARDLNRFNPCSLPPAHFIPGPVQGAVVTTAKRHHEFIADFAPERALLGEAQMVWVGWCAAADQARLLGDKPQVLLVAVALGLGERQHTLVDPMRRLWRSAPLSHSVARLYGLSGSTAKSIRLFWPSLL
jgi:hypothetical protein